MNHGGELRLLTDNFLAQYTNGILLCEGIDDGLFGTIEGLSSKYPKQSIELPCSENASVGMALGSACYGLVPILCYQRVEFALLAIEQLLNNSSKIGYLSNNSLKNPSLFRFIIGRGWGQGPSHSQSLEGLFLQIPEIYLFMPVFPEDSRYIFETFPTQSVPTLSLEHRWVHYTENSGINVKKSSPYVVRHGTDLTIVASSYNVLLALKVAECAVDIGINVEVVNLFALNFDADINPIANSLKKTGKIIFIDLSHSWNGISNNYLSRLCQLGHVFTSPPIVIGCKQSFSPSSFRLSGKYYLNCVDIGNEIAKSMSIKSSKRIRLLELCQEIDESFPPDQPSPSFRGPF